MTVPRFLAAAGLAVLWPAPSGHALDYEKDIMPIFMEKCADCHSSQSDKVKGGLKFDDPKHFQSRFSKNDVVVPGSWDESYLFVTLFRPSDADEAMPPKGKGDRLNLEEVKLVMQWITEGATINGETGKKGVMPEKIEDLFLDLPPDIADQLAKELEVKPGTSKSNSAAAPASPAPPAEEDWTNREGRTLRAVLVKVEGDIAILRMKDGTEHRYPIANLSDESQARVKQAAK